MDEVPPVLRSYINGLKTHDVQMVASAVSEDLAFVSLGRTLPGRVGSPITQNGEF